MFARIHKTLTIFALVTHRGKILEQAIRQSGFNIKEIADHLGVSRNHLYDLFKREKVDIDTLLEVGKKIKHDFIHEIPELQRAVADYVSQPGESHVSSLDQCKEELYGLMRKYAEAMEKMNKLTEENRDLRLRLGS